MFDGLFRQQQVNGIADGYTEAQNIAQRRTELVVERQQRQTHCAHHQADQQLPAGPGAVDEEIKNRREHHRQRADKSGIGNGGVGNAVAVENIGA